MVKIKKSTKFIFKQILNTVFGVFLKIDTRSHGLDKQNAIDMQIQSAKRNKNTSSRHNPFYKGTIHVDKSSRQKCFVFRPFKRILSSAYGHIRFLIMRVLNK